MWQTFQLNKLFLVSILLLFVLLRIPSLFEPYWYGDEGIYQVIGMGLREGRTAYLGVWDNKPPLLFILYALFNGDQPSMRLLSLLFGVLETILFFFISKHLLKNAAAIYVAVGFFAVLLSSPLIEGNIANTENFMLLPILAGMYLFLASNTKNRLLLALSGAMLSIAFLFKVVGVFDLIAIFLVLLLSGRLDALTAFLTGASLPVYCALVYFLTQDLLSPFFRALLLDNAGYTVWKNHFLVKNGLLYIKSVIFTICLILLSHQRKHIPRPNFFIIIWLVCSLYNAYFSGRNYPHYLILLLPSFALFVGLAIAKKRKGPGMLLAMVTLGLLISFQFHIFWNVFGYYQNFVAYHTGSIDKKKYWAFFDPTVELNYAIADYIKDNATPAENIFVWTNAAQIYKLSGKLPPGRLSVAYHIVQNKQTLQETEDALRSVNPKLIIITPTHEPYPYTLDGYIKTTTIGEASVYTRTLEAND